jgi:hypothetical protein
MGVPLSFANNSVGPDEGASRNTYAQALRDTVVRLLERRINEISNETDHNSNGARTILRWLECDVFCFDTCTEFLRKLDDKIPEDAQLVQIDDILSKLIRDTKVIIVSGEDFKSDAGAIEFSDYTLSLIKAENFGSRFILVSELVKQAVATIKNFNWSA